LTNRKISDNILIYGNKERKTLMINLTNNEKELIMEEFVDIMPMLRTRLNLTQEQFGKTIGMTRQTIIYIENRKRKLTWSLFLSMVFVFYMNADTRPFLLASETIKKVFDENNSMIDKIKNLYN